LGQSQTVAALNILKASVKLLNKMATETDVRPMDDKHRNILKKCKGTLVKDMEPDEVLL